MQQPPDPGPRDALFLDFDGTLVDIAPRPDAVVVGDDLIALLRRLGARLDGALAIVSGRPIAQLDHWLAPLRLPAAGVHGAERRTAAGTLAGRRLPSLDKVLVAAEAIAALHAGVRVERKGAAVALHYRQAPECGALCIEAMELAAAASPGLHAMAGKMVVEVLPDGVGKGHAVAAFLREAPFAGRRPVFVGDDVTDEAGFAVVQGAGGIAVKVGVGDSVAAHRLRSPADVRAWLQAGMEAGR